MGIILAPCGDCFETCSLAFLAQVSIPVVLIDRFLAELPLDSVIVG